MMMVVVVMVVVVLVVDVSALHMSYHTMFLYTIPFLAHRP